MAKIDERIKVMLLKGEAGASIKSIYKTASDGLVDTYTVKMTDGTESSFYVTNGRDGKKGDTGNTISVPVSGLFNMGVDADGNLWVYHSDSDKIPEFEYDSSTGNLYYLIGGDD
uniref:Uncharacterized protein n=1 Tax=Siphoviridae sp. ct2773 TaxID=2826275 RepID=A0A8S5QSI6_9CAUD|nr:MAG TPA: hypothetical protein [Siphoviridae sp. ct2773]